MIGFFQHMKFLSKFNFIFFVFILLLGQSHNCAYAKDLKFIQITDSHFAVAGSQYTQREVSGSKGYLENTIKDINSIKNVDFVVFTGDNIDQANDTDLKSFLAIANKLNVPYYMVIGNHEVFKSQHFDKKEYMQIVRKYSKNCRPSGANYVFEKEGLMFVVVDGAKEVIPGPAGYYKKDTLKWLDKTLTKYKNSKVVILQHFPIVEPYYNRTHTTYNIKDYQDVLDKHNNIIAIFSGHYHANGEKMVNGIYHVSTPSLVENPHNYKIIDIVGDKKKGYQIYTQLRHAE